MSTSPELDELALLLTEATRQLERVIDALAESVEILDEERDRNDKDSN